MTKILVYGWYRNDNLGDQLFVEAFQVLFPEYQFTFVNHLTVADLYQADAVFIGGGSLLDGAMSADDGALEWLKQIPLFYLGVGAETDIHPQHVELMRYARLIAIRSTVGMEKVSSINSNIMVIPDLAYALTPTISCNSLNNSLLFLPNITVIPLWNEPHWKHNAWDYFKTEVAQFCDELIQEGTTVHFLPFCTNFQLNDQWAAAEVLSRMQFRDTQFLLSQPKTLSDATRLISRYSVVMTQRYHGAVLADMSKVPCLSIAHHNKLHGTNHSISFYGTTKSQLREQFFQLRGTKVNSALAIGSDSFDQLVVEVKNALGSN